jgi:hypothetical protein
MVGGIMSDEQTYEPLTHTVHVEKKYNLELRGGKKYENEVVGFFQQVQLAADTPAEDVQAVLEQAAHSLMNRLRKDDTPTEAPAPKAKPSLQVVKETFPEATEVAAPSGQVASMTEDEFIAHCEGLKGEDRDKAVTARLASHPDEFYDNREDIASGKVSDRYPTFKHKKGNIPLWVNKG